MQKLDAARLTGSGSRTDKQQNHFTSIIGRIKAKAIKIMAWLAVIWTVAL